MSLFVDIDNLCLNLFALLENIRGMSQLFICYLRNVNKSVNAGDNLRESAEGRHGNDCNLDNIADLVVIHKDCPGVGFLCLVAEGNSALFGIKGLDININFLTDGNNILRI